MNNFVFIFQVCLIFDWSSCSALSHPPTSVPQSIIHSFLHLSHPTFFINHFHPYSFSHIIQAPSTFPPLVLQSSTAPIISTKALLPSIPLFHGQTSPQFFGFFFDSFFFDLICSSFVSVLFFFFDF